MTLREQIKEHGSIRKAAQALGIPRSTLQYRLKREPEQDIAGLVPDDFGVERATITVEPDGTLGRQWLKARFDPQVLREQLEDIRAGFLDTIPKPKFYTKPLLERDENLMSLFVVTDLHLGALSWKEETGADWDISIAEETMMRYIEKASSLAPASKRATLLNLGDLLHTDGLKPVTPMSGHVLDADSRYQKMVRVAIRCIRRAVDILLERHDEVYLINATANHDESAASWLKEAFHMFYENHPRVFVDTSADVYYAMEWGNVSIFAHHGHKRNISNIETVFASKFREIIGRTKYSYAHLGHLHSTEVKEGNLMLIERHRTLAAPDAYASSGGWMSGRSGNIPTYHKDFGEISRVTIPFDMIDPQGGEK